MVRPLRIEYPGALYHVMSRGNAREPITTSDDDQKLFLDVITTAVKRFNLTVHGYCLMENHYHLLVETPDGNLSEGMRYINGTYTQSFNRAHKRVGHVFQGRYKAILVQKESYLLVLIRYIVMNPVKAGLVAAPEDWRWSSYRFAAGYATDPDIPMAADWILAQFSQDRKKARALYREYVTSGGLENPFAAVKGQALLGDDRFVARFSDELWDKEYVIEIVRRERYQGRPPLDALFKEEVVANKTRRNEAICEAALDYGYTLKQIADALGVHYTTVSKVINREGSCEHASKK